MQVDVITEIKDLETLRADWERLYQQDPEAQLFVSWNWLVPYMRHYDGAWFVLAARPGVPGTPYVALLPLRMRTRMNKATGLFFNEINMAGNSAADYTGAICAPEHAESALRALGHHVARMGCARLNLENLRMSRQRIFAFIGQFSRDTFTLSEYSRVNKADNVDNCRCFAAALPDSFDAYLDGVLHGNARQKLRRFLRKVDAGELRIARADASTHESDIEALLAMWRIQWGARKGERLQTIERTNRRVLRDSFKAGTLFMPMLWQGERLLGMLAVFVDPVKKSLLFFMAGRDATVRSIPVGLILHGHCIKLAIESGIATYDFMRGDEPYKFTFGVTESRVNCAAIHTRSGRNVGDRLDPRSLDEVFLEVTKTHRAGQLARAENGYRQILATNPGHAHARYGLAQSLSAKGDHREAVAHYTALVAADPGSFKVWFRLGCELQALSRHETAVNALRQAHALAPDFAPATLALAESLGALGRGSEAVDIVECLIAELVLAPRAAHLRPRAEALLRRLRQQVRPNYILMNPPLRAASSPMPLR